MLTSIRFLTEHPRLKDGDYGKVARGTFTNPPQELGVQLGQPKAGQWSVAEVARSLTAERADRGMQT
jgi:hypothetical protein